MSDTQRTGRLLLNAPSVHTGGGLVLLRAILAAWPPDQRCIAWLDARARQSLDLPESADVRWVAPTVAARLRAECDAATVGRKGDRLLCFHGLPPLIRNEASVHVFMQNRLHVDKTSLNGYPWLTRQRLRFERAILRFRCDVVERFWVQTDSMAAAVRDAWRKGQTRSIEVVPFMAADSPARAGALDAPSFDFIYVADGSAHKNHRTLVRAWVELAQSGLRPSLALTLSQRDRDLTRWIDAAIRSNDLAITQLGELSHAQTLALYQKARALVYPSERESFGLPLVEATNAGLPIVAAELDYVRDVCRPAETFDPTSAASIARAVGRFLGYPQPRHEIIGAHEFLRQLNTLGS